MPKPRTFIQSFLIIGALISISSAYAQVRIADDDSTRYVFRLYKPNYFVLEVYDKGKDLLESFPDARLQFSYAFGVTFKKSRFFFVTYSQKSFWSLSKDSAPFREHNFNPGGFIYSDNRITKFLQNLTGSTSIKYASEIGVEHESNGIDGFDSRGWTRVYAKLDLYKAKKNKTNNKKNYGFKSFVKVWYPWSKSEVKFIDSNGDTLKKSALLTENIGYFEASLFFKYPSFEAWLLLRKKSIEAHIKPFKFRSFFPTLLLFWGKGESLQHATENKVRFNIRLGLSLPYN